MEPWKNPRIAEYMRRFGPKGYRPMDAGPAPAPGGEPRLASLAPATSPARPSAGFEPLAPVAPVEWPDFAPPARPPIAPAPPASQAPLPPLPVAPVENPFAAPPAPGLPPPTVGVTLADLIPGPAPWSPATPPGAGEFDPAAPRLAGRFPLSAFADTPPPGEAGSPMPDLDAEMIEGLRRLVHATPPAPQPAPQPPPQPAGTPPANTVSPVPNPVLRNDVIGKGAFGTDRERAPGVIGPHEGVDLLAAPGTAVLSPVDGTIEDIRYPYGSKHPQLGRMRSIWIRDKNGTLIKVFYVSPRDRAGNRLIRPSTRNQNSLIRRPLTRR